MPLLHRTFQRVEINSTPSPAGSAPPAELLRAVVQHILFMHQQIPCIYQELQREVEELLLHKVRPGVLQRKAAKLLTALEPLFSQLTPALAAAEEAAASAASSSSSVGDALPPRTVAAIVLGSSVASPKLVYLLSLSAATDPPSRDGARRLIRSIAAHGMEISTVDPGLSRVHVLLAAPRDAALPSAHFQPRPGLTLKLQRAHVATVDTTAGGGAASGTGEPPEWLRGLVRGFALPPPPPPRVQRREQQQQQQAEAAHDGPVAMETSQLPPPLPPPPFPPLPPPPGDSAADAGGGPWIWWQSTALVKGFRMGGGSDGGGM